MVSSVFTANHFTSVMEWMFVFPQNLYVEALTPTVAIFGDKA